mmetsp:Transcript_52374/g.131592  ORF Transcript_52374/g.131592 Transcript_52374/m.131592 type:complete len:207 (-) Transcript_52374:1784-2404(-)
MPRIQLNELQRVRVFHDTSAKPCSTESGGAVVAVLHQPFLCSQLELFSKACADTAEEVHTQGGKVGHKLLDLVHRKSEQGGFVRRHHHGRGGGAASQGELLPKHIHLVNLAHAVDATRHGRHHTQLARQQLVDMVRASTLCNDLCVPAQDLHGAIAGHIVPLLRNGLGVHLGCMPQQIEASTAGWGLSHLIPGFVDELPHVLAHVR